MFVVIRPRDEVESCWYEPPAYEPRRMPAADGDEMPVPPPAAVRRPERVFAKVRVLDERVTVVEAVRPENGADDVAMVIAGPEARSFAGPIDERAEVR
jgi:hypothetical protein